ncbi:MAG: hypothetical protein JXE07_02585, partial [Candidatus Aminicenantes bacterium]|nr:hypothetical protein [Candidatus Aminicenantes bacterium]
RLGHFLRMPNIIKVNEALDPPVQQLRSARRIRCPIFGNGQHFGEDQFSPFFSSRILNRPRGFVKAQPLWPFLRLVETAVYVRKAVEMGSESNRMRENGDSLPIYLILRKSFSPIRRDEKSVNM